MNKRDVLIWLNSINGITNRSIDKIEEYFTDISSIWYVSKEDILNINGINEKTKHEILKYRDDVYYEELCEKIKKSGATVVTILDERYPVSLLNIYDSPKVLYVMGELISIDNISIAIVGSRKATAYGKWAAERFADELGRMGITIVSGLARGIDTQVHTSALNANAKTIAVLGCGVDIVYPSSNRELYNKILNNGCIISEFPLGTRPLPQNFPQRNRIISGLSLGVVVIEASDKSGSLITANHAIEQGKDVFALPGNINSIYSRGTNLLIKDGAKLLMSVEDIVEEIGEIKQKYKDFKKEEVDYSSLSENEFMILKCISEKPVHCDMISYLTGIDISKTNSILTILEMKNLIRQLPGKVFTIR